MRLGTMVEDLMEYFKEKEPIIHIQTEILPDDKDVVEVYVKFQNGRSTNNGVVEMLRRTYAYHPHGYGDDNLVWVGNAVDELFFVGFRFKPTRED